MPWSGCVSCYREVCRSATLPNSTFFSSETSADSPGKMCCSECWRPGGARSLFQFWASFSGSGKKLVESYKHPHKSVLQEKMAGGTTGPGQRRHPAFYYSLIIIFKRDMNVLMGQLWKPRLLKLSVKCKAQIPKKLVAAFNLWLCKCDREQQVPCDTCW